VTKRCPPAAISGCIFFHDHPADHAPVQTNNIVPEGCAMAGALVPTTAMLATAASKNTRRFIVFLLAINFR
jgi:hypothetical protein